MNSCDNCCNLISVLMHGRTYHFNLEIVDHKMVERLLNGFSENTSPSNDNLDGKIINVAANILIKPIQPVFNQPIISGTFPDLWK